MTAEGPVVDAQIRTELAIPLRLHGMATLGRVFTFDGLVDGREHLAIGLGSCAAPVRGLPAADEPPAPAPSTDPRIAFTPGQLAAGFAVLAGLVVLLAGRRAARRDPSDRDGD